MQILANTGFLFPSLTFLARIRAAAAAGFDAVECHDEMQREDPAALADCLAEAGLTVGGLNTRMGARSGCAALPGETQQFLADMRAAEAVAGAVGARAIHVVAGRGETCRKTYIANLRHALDMTDRMVLIEPISRLAMPDYHLQTLEEAVAVLDDIGDPRLSVMFDWFHVCAEAGPDAALDLLLQHRRKIGHVQVASYPARAEPDPAIVRAIGAAGFPTLGFEYRPTLPEHEALARIRAEAIA
ncbi:MAG: TIM barrel protein [Roseinatronobacter sp.]